MGLDMYERHYLKGQKTKVINQKNEFLEMKSSPKTRKFIQLSSSNSKW